MAIMAYIFQLLSGLCNTSGLGHLGCSSSELISKPYVGVGDGSFRVFGVAGIASGDAGSCRSGSVAVHDSESSSGHIHTINLCVII